MRFVCLVIRAFRFNFGLLLFSLALCGTRRGVTLGKCVDGQSQRIFADICKVPEASEVVPVDLEGFDNRLYVLVLDFVGGNSIHSTWVLVNQICFTHVGYQTTWQVLFLSLWLFGVLINPPNGFCLWLFRSCTVILIP